MAKETALIHLLSTVTPVLTFLKLSYYGKTKDIIIQIWLALHITMSETNFFTFTEQRRLKAVAG